MMRAEIFFVRVVYLSFIAPATRTNGDGGVGRKENANIMRKKNNSFRPI